MTRELPEIASTPGDVDVTLTVLFDGDVPKGAIIKEYLPQGFEPVSSTPAYAAFDTVSREIKWVLFSSSMSQTMEISYRIRINTAQNVSFPFLGYLLYNDSQGMSQYLEATGDRNLETYSQHITVTRTLPITYVAPSTFESIIDIAIEGRSPNGLIITEKLPAGVTAVSASLAWNSYDPTTGQIKWVLIEQEIYSRSITYFVEVTHDLNQELEFSGNIKYKDPLSQDMLTSTAGDSSVVFGSNVQQVSGARSLPSICVINEETEIVLDIAIAGTAPNGVIVSERLPQGVQFVSTEPAYDTFESSTQTIKWLLSGSEVISQTIRYKVIAPGTESIDAEFGGSLNFNDVLGNEQVRAIKGGIVLHVRQRPIVDAGTDQTVNEGSSVILDGSGSSDPDGVIDGYAWDQTSGPDVILSGATTAMPGFTAPEVNIGGSVLTFLLSVTDNEGLSSTDSVSVTVTNVNKPPVANVGADQTVNEGDSVTLDGSGSSDPDGSIQSYLWDQTAGPDVGLTEGATVAPDFIAPEVAVEGTVLTFLLTVADNEGLNNTDTVSITVSNVNKAPIANAGADQTVNEGNSVTLNGSNSYDTDGEIAVYAWEQTDGAEVELRNVSTTTPVFDVPEVSTEGSVFTFSLTVTDNEGLSDTDTVVITVSNVNKAPIADAGADQTVNEGGSVTLNGSNSSDPDGSIAGYSWDQTSGHEVIISGSSTATPTFIAPEVSVEGSVLIFMLTVTDNEGLNGTDMVSITVNNVNKPPIANAGADQTVNEGSIVTLNGSGSNDPDGTIAGYLWDQTSGPEVALSAVSIASPGFTAPEVSMEGSVIIFSLTVTDNEGATSTDTVTIIISNVNKPPMANAGADQTVNEGSSVTLNSSGSNDPDGAIAVYSWSQTSGPAVVLSGSSTATSAFTAPETGVNGATFVFSLNVTDNEGLSSTDSVSVTVSNVNKPPMANAGADQTVNEGSSVTLNGSNSSDPDGTITGYLWDQTLGPEVILNDASTAAPGFTAPEVSVEGSVLIFMLTVTDNEGLSGTDMVSITVHNVNKPPVAHAGSDQKVNEGNSVTLNGSGSSDPDGKINIYLWTQTSGIEVVLSDTSAVRPSFTAPETGIGGAILEFDITVTDNEGNSASDSVKVIVMNVTMKGDVNDDHKVDLEDALIVMKQLIYNRSYGSEVEAHSSDVNGDGRIGLHEAIYVLKHCAME